MWTSLRTIIRLPGSKTPGKPALPKAENLPTYGDWKALQILEQIGQGAFGTVFRAWDPSLEREVALKIIPLDANAPLADTLAEARLLAQLKHPGIVQVYGASEDAGCLRIWMELLRGQNLHQWVLKHGRMSESEAALIGLRLCDSLAAIHCNGMVHGDIKAQNVMREEGGRIVLMDFGLGQRTTQVSDRIGGTPVYMAPEVIQGSKPDPGSDLYALTVLLYFLFSGDFPFSPGEWDALAEAKRRGPRPLLDLRPNAEPRFQEVVRRGLAGRREERFRSAGELAACLQSVLGQDGGSFGTRLRPSRRQTLLLGTGTVATLGTGAWLRSTGSITPLAEGALGVLAPIRNETGDDGLRVMTNLLGRQLAQSAHFRFLDAPRLRAALQRMVRVESDLQDSEVLREAAWREGAAFAVFGTLSAVGTSYTLQLRIEFLGRQSVAPYARTMKSFVAESRRELFTAVQDASAWVRHSLGESLSQISAYNAPPQEITTSSWEALQDYERAEQLRAQQRTHESVLAFESAVQRDPDFALAWLRLGDIAMSLRREAEGLGYLQKALSKVSLRRLTRREELRIRGMYAFDTGDPATADRYFQYWATEFPNDLLPKFYRSSPLILQNRAEEALTYLEQARKLDPRGAYISAMACNCYLVLGKPQAVRASADEMERLGDADRANIKRAGAAFLEMELGEAREYIQRVRRSANPIARLDAATFGAILSAESGNYPRALAYVEEGLRDPQWTGDTPQRAYLHLYKAGLLWRTGAHAEISEDLRQCLELDPNPRYLAQAGTLSAQNGKVAEAERILTRIADLDDTQLRTVAMGRVQGAILMAKRRYEEACVAFGRAAAAEPALAYRNYLAEAQRRTGSHQQCTASFRRIAAQPGLGWVWLQPFTPGTWFEALKSHCTLVEGSPYQSTLALLQSRQHNV